jgi:large subunit ribosomal protein L25
VWKWAACCRLFVGNWKFSLPDQIPENISVDITDLDIGDSFHVQDLQLEGDVEIPADVNFTILTVLAPKAEEEEVEGEEEEEMGEEVAEGAEADEEPASE